MSLKATIQNDIKDCMRNQEKAQLAILRLISSEIKQREIDERITLDDTQIIAVLDKMQKQRRDSLQQFLAANRQDLAEQEQFELDLIQKYLPTPYSETEIATIITQTIQETGANSPQQMGLVMAKVKPLLQGRADMAQVSRLIKESLSKSN